MKYQSVKNVYILTFEKDEEVNDRFAEFVKENNIQAGFFSGIGGVQKATLGYYNMSRKKYIFRSVKNAVELVSLQGNISWIADQPIIHMHASVSDMRNKVHGGHVRKLVCAATIEIMITVLDCKLQRKLNTDVGLPILDL